MRTFLLLCLLSFSFMGNSQTIYVNHAATGANNGSSWANAYTSLQTALTSITTSERTVWIAQGTYKPSASNRSATFTINELYTSLYGGFNGTETLLNQRDFINNKTILSGDLLGNDDATVSFSNTTRNDNSYQILKVNATYNIIDGLVFTGGHANGAGVYDSGAAIYKIPAVLTLTVRNCEFKNNVSTSGAAGIQAIYNSPGNGNLTVENSIFENNLSTVATSIYSYTTTPITLTIDVRNSLFNGNKVLNNAQNDAYAGSGGWFRAVAASSTVNVGLKNNTYVNNEDLGTNSNLENYGTVGFSKEGFSTINLNATVNNCIFWNNTAATSTAPAINNIITLMMPNVAVNNSLDSDNFSTILSKANCIQGDPLFVSATNFNLTASSPAVDTGINTSISTNSKDLAGNPRIVNSIVDMGAYEYNAALSVSEFTPFSDFILYPNPASNLLNVNSIEDINTIEIYSIEGKMVLTSQNTQIDVSHLNAGMYLVQITFSNGKAGTKKLVKQ